MFEIQERLSRTIVDALKLTLTPEEAQLLAERPIDHPKAHECYLQARQEIFPGECRFARTRIATHSKRPRSHRRERVASCHEGRSVCDAGHLRDEARRYLATGYRESEQSWRELLLDVRHRGLTIDPELAIGDGGLGFWGALRKVFPQTREQRCWVHKTANVLNKLPKGVQPKAKAMLHDIWMAETQAAADHAFDLFVATFAAKFPAATTCLVTDRDVLLTFYAFPAEHWIHIRTTNPVESTFATVRLRTKKTKGAGSRLACLTMVFKLAMAAQKQWRALNGSQLVADVIDGVPFVDGVRKEAA